MQIEEVVQRVGMVESDIDTDVEEYDEDDDED
jgi:hypothetical protein